jgi:hypothetical protein
VIDPAVPLVAMSAVHDLEAQCASMCIGRWVSKPFQLAQIRQVIEELLGQEVQVPVRAPAPDHNLTVRIPVGDPERMRKQALEPELTPFSCAGRPGLVDPEETDGSGGLLYPMAGASGLR